MRLLSIILHPIIDSTTGKISHFIKHFFSARVVNTWNSLTNSVVDACTVSAFKARLDKFWQQRAVKCDFTADLTHTRKRSEEVIK